jgi:acetylornithine deacetylase
MSDVIELLRRLVAVDSVNPELVPGGAGERAIARVVGEWLHRAGLEVKLEEVAPGRPNVIALARGTGDGPSLVLNAHMDTVGVAGMNAPHEPRLENGRLYGRGAYDMKAGLAAAMVAAASVGRLAGDVIVTAVCDEEAGALGTRGYVAGQPQVSAAIVTEPTEENVAVAHKGFVGFEIETAGRAAHGSRPDEGRDAIVAMGPILAGLGEHDEALAASRQHPLLGRASLHASLIEGGQEFSSYPERCMVTGEWRTLPGDTVDDVRQGLEDVIGRHSAGAEVRLLHIGEPFEVPADAAIAQLVLRHAGTELVGVSFWADSSLLAGAGIPTVLYGPAGGGAHAVEEWVDVASVERVCDVLTATAREFCGVAR